MNGMIMIFALWKIGFYSPGLSINMATIESRLLDNLVERTDMADSSESWWV